MHQPIRSALLIMAAITTSPAAKAAPVPALSTTSDSVLFSYHGKEYRLKDLQPWLQQSFYDAQVKAKQNMEQILNQAMVEMYVEQMATQTNRSIDDIRKELFKAEAVTQSEIQQVYDQLKDRIGLPLKEVEARIRQELENEKRQIAIRALIQRVRKETGFISKLSEPEAPTFAIDLKPYPFKGSAKANITVVEFADYNCGYCRKSKPEIDKVMKQYRDKVKLYYVDFPVTEKGIPGSTTQTARGAYCAGKQGKFWAYHDLAYKEPVTMNTAGKLAKTLKLDEKSFQACLNSKASGKFVSDSVKLADKLGVNGTPTLFINGKRLHTHDVGKDLKVEIEKLLSQK